MIAGLISSIYTVQAESQGVVLRFGSYLTTVDPGLRFKLPFGIDKVYVLPVKRQLKQEYGFGTPAEPMKANLLSLVLGHVKRVC